MPLKLGMLGLAHSHAAGLVKQAAAYPDEFTLAGFFDPDPKVLGERKGQWSKLVPNFRGYERAEDLLKQDLDAVIVESLQFENLRLAKLGLESGRPVLLEKPAGADLAEHRRLIELAQRKNLHVQMLYLFRYMSAVQEMLKVARAGELEKVYMFRARLPKDLASYDRYVDELGRYKGGIFFEMAGHVIDMMVAILGKPKSVTPFMAHHHSVSGDFVDNGVAIFGFDNAWGIIEVPALEVVQHTRRIEVYGTGGACIIPHLGSGHLANKNVQPIDIAKKGGRWKTLELPAATLQIRDLREFAAVIGGKKVPDFSMEHDLIVQETLLKASGM